MKVLCIDPSLTSLGYAEDDGTTGVVQPKSRGVERLAELDEWMIQKSAGVDVVYLEGYAYARANQAHQIGELGGVLRLVLHYAGVEVVVVPPASLKKFATGKGNATKELMVSVATKRSGRVFDGSDESDAWLLWAYAMHREGRPEAPDWPKGRLSAIEGRVDTVVA